MSVCTFLSTALLFFTPRKHHSAHLLSVVTFKFSLKHYFLLCYFYENFRVFFSPPIYFTSTTLVVFLDSGSLYFFFLITIKFQKWEKKKKDYLFHCSKNDSTDSSLQKKMLRYFLTYFKNCKITDLCSYVWSSNFHTWRFKLWETKYEVTKPCLQSHSTIIQSYRSLCIQCFYIQKKTGFLGHVKESQSQGLLQQFYSQFVYMTSSSNS